MHHQEHSKENFTRPSEAENSRPGFTLPFHTIQPAPGYAHSLFTENGEPRRRMPSPTMTAIAQAHFRPRLPDPLQNPLSYTWQQDQSPWSPDRLTINNAASGVGSRPSIHPSPTVFNQPFSGVTPGTGSGTNHESAVDSAYETGSTGPSIGGLGRPTQDQNPRKGKSKMDEMRPPPKKRKPSSSAESEKISSCEHCGQTFRLPSESKKHRLRHEKPHLCDFSGCERNSNGFTTINDLERHKKSRHGIMPPGSKVYKCASESCVEKNKTWPRLDNFRQHCDRMHKNEDTQVLIERSETSAESCSPSEPCYSAASSPNITFDFARPTLPSLSTQSGPAFFQQTSSGSWVGLPSSAVTHRSASFISNSIDEGFGSQFDPSESHPLDMNDLDMQPLDSTGASFSTSHGAFDPLADLGGMPGHLSSPMSSGELPFAIFPDISSSSKSLPDKSSGSSSSDPLRRTPLIRQGQDESPTDVCGSPDSYDFRLAPLEQSFGQLFHDTSNRVTDVTHGHAGSFSLPSQTADHKTRARDAKGRSFSSSSSHALAAPAERLWEKTSGEENFGEGKAPRLTRPAEPLKCPICSKVVQRHCDMKKHVARHERPFGCTYETCTKKFGSKNDWKRHEHTQHFHNSFPSFWCGFCQQHIPVDRMDTKPWEARSDHVSIHYRKGMRVDSWVLADGHGTKGDVENEQLAEAARSN